jgi:hypothetical protein
MNAGWKFYFLNQLAWFIAREWYCWYCEMYVGTDVEKQRTSNYFEYFKPY